MAPSAAPREIAAPRREERAWQLAARATAAALALLAAALALHSAAPPPASAQERLVRAFAEDHGLAAPPVWAIAQDSAGFLWIGAEGGLFRFDGEEIRRWAPDSVRYGVANLAVGPGGRLVIRDLEGSLFEVLPTGARRVPSPPPYANPPAGTLAFDAGGDLWKVDGGTLRRGGPDGTWIEIAADALGGERPRGVAAAAAGGMLVTTDAGLWALHPATAPRKLYSARDIIYVLSPEADRIVILMNVRASGAPRVVEIAHGRERELLSPRAAPGGRAISLAERNGTVWMAMDRFLLALRPGEAPQVLGRDQGVGSGGPLFVDREESLWLGSFHGLLQFPEPDTRLWTEREGLPSHHTRFVAATGAAVWVVTWAGTTYLHHTGTAISVGPRHSASSTRPCLAGGALWAAWAGSIVEVRDTVATPRAGLPPGVRMEACTAARDGGVWLGTSTDLRYADTERNRVLPVPSPAGTRATPHAALLHDSRDRVWTALAERICHARADRLRRVDAAAWSCDTVQGAVHFLDMVELPSGSLWLSSARRGVFTNRGDGWRPLPMEGLPTRTVFALVPSPRGGVWMVGHGILQRVRETGDGGWEVLERLTSWHGLVTAAGGDLLEEADGTLWIATSRGVSRVPPEVRFASLPVPLIALVEARVDDEPLPPGPPVRLAHDRNRVELRFAALSFRDPAQIRHQVRLAPDEPWMESRGRRPAFRWMGLQPGSYEVEYRASVDGLDWSAEPIRFAFEVRPPWYRTSWVLVLAVLLSGTLAWVGYRARVAYLLQLERQRTRIAMDLHDEVGSGLASVGILSGVLAADGLDERERRETAVEIATAAEELGNALSDIVWSLDPRAATLEELAARLAEHGERLWTESETEFSTAFPQHWPAARPSVAVRRNVLLVGLEALHNAARHAGARRVALELLPEGGGDWRLAVTDDGAGFATEPCASGRGGHGLPGMRQRAEEIGGSLEVRSVPGRGTAVALRFRLTPRWTMDVLGLRLRELVPWRTA